MEVDDVLSEVWLSIYIDATSIFGGVNIKR
jgi:hypothetical protein